MLPHKPHNASGAKALGYALAEQDNFARQGGQAMAYLALSHTQVEHLLYRAMFAETNASETRVGVFSIRRLMVLTGLGSYSTIRRGLLGLHKNLSIEQQKVAVEPGQENSTVYIIYTPEEIFARRRRAGLAPYPKIIEEHVANDVFSRAVERVTARHDVSRREAQVALACAEGLTNAEIGKKLCVSEDTVKFHLRHIFIKFGVKRRAELVSRLLMREADGNGKRTTK